MNNIIVINPICNERFLGEFRYDWIVEQNLQFNQYVFNVPEHFHQI